MLAKLTWTDRKGGNRMAQGEAAVLAKRLKTLRCKAKLTRVVDGEVIGGCEPASGHDDKRIKWQWWYDASEVGEFIPADRMTLELLRSAHTILRGQR